MVSGDGRIRAEFGAVASALAGFIRRAITVIIHAFSPPTTCVPICSPCCYVKSPSQKFPARWFPASVTAAMRDDRYPFVHLDADLEAPIAAGLEFFWPRVSPGGMIVVHDYNGWPGARTAVDRFRQQEYVVAIPMPDKSGSIVLAK